MFTFYLKLNENKYDRKTKHLRSSHLLLFKTQKQMKSDQIGLIIYHRNNINPMVDRNKGK